MLPFSHSDSSSIDFDAGMYAYISKSIDLKACLQQIKETLRKAADPAIPY
jgi:hypothetical protein